MKIKKLLLLLLVCSVCYLSMGAVLHTNRAGIDKPRAAVTSDDTLLSASATTMTTSDIAIAGAYVPGDRHNAIEVTWTMGADAQSCVAYIFAARKNGDVVLVWTGTITAGTQVATDARFYVDTIASSTDNWPKTITETDIGGNNRMSRLTFDTMGYTYFLCQYTGLSSESVQAVFSGY